MILHKETHKKFGYYPKDLANRSNKVVVVKCDNCSIIREIKKDVHNRRSHYRCRQCACKIGGAKLSRTRQNRKTSLINSFGDKKPTIEQLLSIITSWHISNRGLTIDICLKGQAMKQKYYLPVLGMIGFKQMPNNTKNIKNMVMGYIKTNKLHFEVLNFYLNSLTPVLGVGVITLASINNPYILELIEMCNFKFKKLKRGISIIEGSFYINNHWVHVG